MKCPICKNDIEDRATKCEHCGSYTRKGRRVWFWVRDVGQFVTFITAIVVLILMYQSNQRMQDQLTLQIKSAECDKQQFLEGMRPRVEFSTPKIDFTDTCSMFYVDFNNMGVVDAEDLSIYFVLKYEDAPNRTLYSDTTWIDKLTKASPLHKSWTLPVLKKLNLICFIKVRYTWTIQNLDYENEKYYHFFDYNELGKYRVYRLDDAQVKELWK